MLGSQDLMNVSIATDMPWAIDKKTCRLIPNHDIYVMLLMNCFEEIRSSMVQKRTKRIARKSHWSCVQTPQAGKA